jgi:hypothetical protein
MYTVNIPESCITFHPCVYTVKSVFSKHTFGLRKV